MIPLDWLFVIFVTAAWMSGVGFCAWKFFLAEDPGPLTVREARAVEETKRVEALARTLQAPQSNVVHVEFRRAKS